MLKKFIARENLFNCLHPDHIWNILDALAESRLLVCKSCKKRAIPERRISHVLVYIIVKKPWLSF